MIERKPIRLDGLEVGGLGWYGIYLPCDLFSCANWFERRLCTSAMHLSFVLSVLGACLRDEAHLDTGLHTQSRAARSRVRMEAQHREGHAADDLFETTTFLGLLVIDKCGAVEGSS